MRITRTVQFTLRKNKPNNKHSQFPILEPKLKIMKKLLTTVVITSLFLVSGLAQKCIEGDCINGRGTFLYASGAKYTGDFKNGKIDGTGVLEYTDGRKYIGEWKENKRQGKGRLYSEEGTYFGEFNSGEINGEGEISYKNGDKYVGQWVNGKQHGQGTFYYKSGDKYEGEFKDGEFSGLGTMFYQQDGSKYVGQWQNGKRHGEGTLFTSTGAVKAQWENGQRREELAFDTKQGESGQVQIDRNPAVKVWAVVVGVGSYEHMQSLRYTDDDAYHVFAFLKSPEGGALPDEQIKVLIDEDATYRNIIATMRRVLLRADENDVVLFYFSGHGLEGSFLAVDYDGINNRVRHDEIRQIMDQSRAKHKIIFADACHSGSLDMSNYTASKAPLDATLARYYRAFETTKGGLALLMSSKSKEYSLEDGGLRSGIFSYYLVRGLKGEADKNNDKIVTINELYNFVYEKVRFYTAGVQTPILTGSFDRGMPVAVIR